jgi:hypothetical protein
LGVIGVSRDFAGFGLLGQVAGVVVLIECLIDPYAALDKPVVGVISPSPLNPAVGNSVVILIPQFNTAFGSGLRCAMRTLPSLRVRGYALPRLLR